MWSESSTEPKRPNVIAFHNYSVKIKLKGEEVFMRLLVREQKAGKLGTEKNLYDHDATTVEAIMLESVNQPDRKPKAGENQQALANNKLYQWWNGVNENDVSKVVDENGEPALTFRGSTKDFAIFSDTQTGATSNGESAELGFWFTDNLIVADIFTAQDFDLSTEKFNAALPHKWLLRPTYEIGLSNLETRCKNKVRA